MHRRYQRPVSATPAANFATYFVDTSGKFATGVNETSDKFAAGVNDTGGKFATGVIGTILGCWDLKVNLKTKMYL